MPIPVLIIGDHPHAGRTGQLVELQKFKHGLPDMGKVEFDEPNHEGEACYAQAKNLRVLSSQTDERSDVPKCDMTMGEYRNYYKCGRPAKFEIADTLRGRLKLCGIHAHALRRRGREPQPIKRTAT